MRAKACVGLIWLLGLAVSIRPEEQKRVDERSVLSLPIFPAPTIRDKIPFTQALGVVGAYVQKGYVLFGVELRPKDGQEPLVNVNLQPGTNLGDALRQVIDQVPGYQFQVVSAHMINVYPAGTEKDPQNVLNTIVRQFDADNLYPSDLLSRPQDFIAELKARLVPKKSKVPQPGGYIGPGITGGGPTVTLHLKNVTVRQILNAVSEAMEQFPPNLEPVGWLYSFQPDPNSPIGGKHSWMFLWSAPRNWKEQAGEDRSASL